MDYSTSRSPSPSSSATIHLRSLFHELRTGHGAAEQLRRRLIRSPDSPPVEDLAAAHSDLDLAEAIVNSLSKSLSIVENCDPSMINARSPSDDCKIEDSNCGGGGGESVRTKDRRGCYKRRRRGQSWTTEGEAPTQDCYAWRKYGQKSILNSQFPRNYYRCTHKTDQGCQAIKHVQKISEDPPRYRTTYSGEHTCKTPLRPSQIILPSSSPDQSDSSFLLSFDRSSNSILNPFFPPSSDNSFAIKEEFPTTNTTTTAQATMMNMTMMMNQASSSDYNHLSSPDLTGGPHVTGLSTPGSDCGGDVISAGTYSCSPSPHSLEIDNYIIAGQDHLDIHPFDCDIIV